MKRCWMRKGLLTGAALAVSALCLGGAVQAAPAVTLPEGYEEGERCYPVLYFLGEDEACLAGIQEAVSSPQALDMILVQVIPEEDVFAQMAEVVAQIDGEYRTVADPSARAIAGSEENGYLALALAYTDGAGELLTAPSLFGLVGGISPVFTGEKAEVDFPALLQAGAYNNFVANQFYTFLQTPSEAEISYAAGGANDVIAAFIQKGAAYAGMYENYYGNADDTVLALTIPHAEDGAEFRANAAKEMCAGFSKRILRDLVSGSVLVSPQAAGEEVESVQAGCRLSFNDGLEPYHVEGEVPLTFAILSGSGEALGEAVTASVPFALGKAEEAALAELPNLVEGESSQITLSAKLLGMEVPLGQAPLVRILSAGEAPEEQFVDLAGTWLIKAEQSVNQTLPEKEEMDSWEEVIPCLGWWNADFSKVQNLAAYIGYVWYGKTFTLPEDYPEGTYVLSLGGMDEADMVWVNGKLVGYSGMNADTWEPEYDAWDKVRAYEVSSEDLVFGGENVVYVLVHNQSGDGGWYAGHPRLFTQAAYDAYTAQESGGLFRFVQEQIPSAHKAAALGSGEETAQEDFLVYLPEGYEENPEKSYPVVYLLHQLNSSSTSYVMDHIDALLDAGIREGLMGEVIVVIPDSAPDSWWMGEWEKMVTEEILPYVEEKYRTINDREHRFTAGASMGGHGAFSVAFANPDLFSGIISYFGAINMGTNPVATAMEMDDETLASFKYYFVCGNRDLYKFGIPSIALDRYLREKDVPHYFTLGEGEHNSVFYLPFVQPSFGYMIPAEE